MLMSNRPGRCAQRRIAATATATPGRGWREWAVRHRLDYGSNRRINRSATPPASPDNASTPTPAPTSTARSERARPDVPPAEPTNVIPPTESSHACRTMKLDEPDSPPTRRLTRERRTRRRAPRVSHCHRGVDVEVESQRAIRLQPGPSPTADMIPFAGAVPGGLRLLQIATVDTPPEAAAASCVVAGCRCVE